MNSKLENAIQACVARLLSPLVRLLLRYGVPFATFIDIAKRIYVEAAMESLAIPGRIPSVSRASVITGLSRKEIARVTRLPRLSDEAARDRYNRATRLLGGWARDEEFAGSGGRPAVLPFGGGRASFSALVKQYSGDVPARAVLDELVRVGSVERRKDGKIKLLARAYIPSEAEEEKINILGGDVADLIETIDHNLQNPEAKSRFQLKVSYDNLPREALGRFRETSSRRALKLLEALDKELARVDRDVNPDSQGTGRMRAGLSIYYFEEELPLAATESEK